MFIIDKPYASNFLINTIKTLNYRILKNKFASGLINDNSLNWVSEKEAVKILNEKDNAPFYTNSENAVAWINEHSQNSSLESKIDVFKNKVKFRELIKEEYPDFYFGEISLRDLLEIDISELKFPLVIKPSVGFFSVGVHIINDYSEWESVKEELNVENLRTAYPKEVIDTSTFIIEEYIEGEEYAVDCYFNNENEAVLLNIMHHRFSSDADTSDRVYSTSKLIFSNLKDKIESFLEKIGSKMDLRNFPLHLELRIDNENRIQPIEINPIRFGGWCTTADLAKYSLGINLYSYFYENLKPDIDSIYENLGDDIYSLIVLNNNSGVKGVNVKSFNYSLLEKDFEDVLEVRKTDYKTFPLFGFLFTRTSLDNEIELEKILHSDLKKYINKK